jgi:hypothetical protein
MATKTTSITLRISNSETHESIEAIRAFCELVLQQKSEHGNVIADAMIEAFANYKEVQNESRQLLLN